MTLSEKLRYHGHYLRDAIEVLQELPLAEVIPLFASLMGVEQHLKDCRAKMQGEILSAFDNAAKWKWKDTGESVVVADGIFEEYILKQTGKPLKKILNDVKRGRLSTAELVYMHNIIVVEPEFYF